MIKCLLLSGANNHDWRRSSPFVKQVLEESGLFEVTLTENPSDVLEDAEGLSRYQLIFSDYYGPEWSTQGKGQLRGGGARRHGAGGDARRRQRLPRLGGV